MKYDVGSDAGGILASLTPGQVSKFRAIMSPQQSELFDRWKNGPQDSIEIIDPGSTFIGFVTRSVPPGAHAYITRRPFVPFKPRRLVVAPKNADHFSILDYYVGKNSQTPAAEEAPAACFPPIPANAPPGDLEAWFKATTLWVDVVGPGFDLRVLVKNNDPSRCLDFEAVFFGLIDPKHWGKVDW